MKVFTFILWTISLIAFTIGCCVDVNLMPGWDVILTAISGVIFSVLTLTKGFGIEIPVLQPAIKKLITAIVLHIQRKQLEKFYNSRDNDEL